MAISTLSLALAALATTTLLARALTPVVREARNCLLLWLALHGTRPDQRPDVLEALPPLDGHPVNAVPSVCHDGGHGAGSPAVTDAGDMNLPTLMSADNPEATSVRWPVR